MLLPGSWQGLQTRAARAIRRALGAVRLSRPPALPRVINWDLTYACPLRCEHCYSESGRRDKRQLPLPQLMQISDIFLRLRPVPEVVFTGGEPLVIRGCLELARHLAQGGARVSLYTSGWKTSERIARQSVALFHRVSVSIDGADRETNDRIRGRVGAFSEAAKALGLFDRALAELPTGMRARLGIECTVTRSNLRHLDGLATDLAPRFPRLSFIRFGAAIPTGLASEKAYAERELLDETELDELRRSLGRLRSLAPRGVSVDVFDNAAFLLRSDQVKRGVAHDDLVKIEADGRMRAMDIYEGTVGNVLEEPFEVLWRRACVRHRHPFVRAQLDGVRTMQEWAAATRAIDRFFGAPAEIARIEKRAERSSREVDRAQEIAE